MGHTSSRVLLRKVALFFGVVDETCREWTLDIYAGVLYVFLELGHQGAELLSKKGEKMGVLAFCGWSIRGPNRW